MKTKFMYLTTCLVLIFSACLFSACGDDDDSNGINGVYATPTEFDSDVHQYFRLFIIVSDNMVKRYYSYATDNPNYWKGGYEIPEAPGWYVESKSIGTNSYVEYEGKLVLDNGDIYVIDGNSLVKNGVRYSKYK